MNKIYALVWNPTQDCWNVASENCSRKGKQTNKRRLAVALSLLSLAALEPAHALPNGQNIVAGQGSITANGQHMTVSQQSDKLITQWDNFNVGAAESVTFQQPGSNSVALNRVMGVNGSDIQGKIDANGKVFIVNPNGVVFGKNAQVNVGGLVASTRDISNADFLAGKNRFTGKSQAEVRNEGTLTTAQSGSVALLGAQVNNQGVILAKMGSIALGAGDDITLNFDGNKLLSLQVNEAAVDALVQNGSLLRAEGGQVLMTAKAAGDVLKNVVNNQGAIEANTLNNQAGRIVLDGGDSGVVNVAGRLNANADTLGDGGTIETRGKHMKVNLGTQVATRAASGKTGTWKLATAEVNVGDAATVTMKADTLMSALENSNVALTSARGDVAVSAPITWKSANQLSLTAERAGINLSAPLKSTGTGGGLALNHKTGYALNNDTSLTLSGAGASFSINGDSYKVIQSLAQLQEINQDLNARYVLGNNISSYSRINAIGGSTTFNGSFDGLGNTVHGLTIVNNGPFVGLFNSSAGHLSNLKLDSLQLAAGDKAMYSGALTGINLGTISNVKATNISISGVGEVGGLIGVNFGTLAHSSASGKITGNSNNYAVGGLVGTNYGDVLDSQANVAITSTANSIGGLVGRNAGLIADSSSRGKVSASGYEANIGGLVGINEGEIHHASSESQVIGYRTGAIGGLIGYNYGILNNADASGEVTDNSGRNIGGLIGINDKNAQVHTVRAANHVTGGNNANIGGLIGQNNARELVNAFTNNSKVKGGSSGQIGGLIGHNQGAISQVTAISDVEGGANSNVGGLVGLNDITATGGIEFATASGNVVGGTGSAVGGLAGSNASVIRSSSASGRVNSLGVSQRGGLVGVNIGLLTDSSFSGTVMPKSITGQWVGSLVGVNIKGVARNNTAYNAPAGQPLVGQNLYGIVE
ncbi:TPA: filamentous hemagglutinin N-terminal domain-containing protein [Serratia marcescens]